MTALTWAWGVVWLVAAWVWPIAWIDRLKPDPDCGEWRVMRWPLAAGLGLGGLTLWLIVAGFWRLNVWVALAFPAALVLAWAFAPRSTPGTWRGNTSVVAVRSGVSRFVLSLRQPEAGAWVLAAGLAALVVVAAQSTYYPFIGDDEISRYAFYARLMVFQGGVTSEVRGYPMFLSAAYAFVFLASGQLAEQLARLIPAAVAALTVLATGGLARRWYGARAGWAAAFVLVATPLYLHWAPDGYVDIASGLYFVLCAHAADVWLSARKTRWAAMAGGLAGLALWTKQAGFVALACLGIVIGWGIVRDWMKGDRQAIVVDVRHGLLALATAFLCGGWWYVRNAYYDGWRGAIPDPGQFYFQLANHRWAYLVPFLGDFRSFGAVASLLYIAGLLWGMFRLGRAARALVWCIPYTILWWRLFSYDPRFILTVLPFYATLFGGLVAEMRWPVRATGLWRWGLAAAIVLAACASVAAARLGGLRQWVVAPTATYAGRLYRAKGDMYPVVEFLRDHVPASARVVSMDGRLRYYLIDRPIDVFYPSRAAELRAYDYFVVGSWWATVYPGFGLSDSDVPAAFDDASILRQVYVGPNSTISVYQVVTR